ncbi:MAG: M2 family metallopeptidase [Gaiellales bacterium]
MTEATALCQEAEERLRPLFLTSALAAWDANVVANDENEARRVAADVALSDALADPALYGRIVEARKGAAEGATRRQLDLLYGMTATSQAPEALRHRLVELEAAVEGRFAQHRGVVRGAEVTDNEILEILRRSNDIAERREAWEASKTVGALVAEDVRALARLRNEIARSLGHRDWFAFALDVSEMSEDKLFVTLDACDAATRELFTRWKQGVDAQLAERFGCGVDELRPWHYADPFFQDVPAEGGIDLDPLFADRDVVALAGATFSGFGLPTDDVLARSDLYPRDAKCQHAFCLDVDRAGDVRVLANVRNDASWADTMLHELGHAAYDLGYADSLPWLLRDCHLTMTEGIAIMMGALARDPEWLRTVAGFELEESNGLQTAHAADALVFTRWVLVMTHFERALYADPDANLDTIWWELVARFQGLTPPEERQAPDWAAKIHIACAPVYYHTYLYGHLVAAQLRAAIRRTVGGLVGRPEAGAFLRERVFGPGASLRWDHLLEHATGEPLDVSFYAAELRLT